MYMDELESVWVVMDTSTETGKDSIKAVLATVIQAKLFIAEYVLEYNVNSEYLELFERVILDTNERPDS